MATEAVVVKGVLGDTLSETKDFTSSGFGTPTAAVIYVTAASTANNPQANASMTVGFWDGTNTVCVASSSYDARSSATRASRLLTTGRVVNTPVWDVSIIGIVATVSSITDGIRLTVTVDNTSVERHVMVLLLKGTTNVSAATYQLSTGTSYDITDPGFKPDLVFMVSIADSSVPTTGTNQTSQQHSILSYGVVHNSSSDFVSQGVLITAARDGEATSQNNQYVSDSYTVGQVFADEAQWLGSVGSFDASGFTLTTTANPGGDYIAYLAVKLADPDDAWVGVIDSATSMGTDATTGVGFQPDAIGLMTSTLTATGSVSAGLGISFGLADGTTEGAVGCHDEDGLTTTNASSKYYAGALQILFDDGTDDALATLSSLDSDGFTLNYSDGSATARKILAFAIGDSTATGVATVTLSNPLAAANGQTGWSGSCDVTYA